MTREEKMWEAVEKEHGKLSRREAFVALTAMEWADKTMIDKAKAWVKNSFIGPFGEGLADNIADEFVKYLEE